MQPTLELTLDAANRRSAPSVCVVITTYNHARYLGEAIESVLSQTRPVDDVLVVDDGSTDDPGAVVARHPGVRMISQVNQGLSAARNTGLRASDADAILFLDADDRLRPLAIELGLKRLAEAPEAAFVYGGFHVIDREGRLQGAPTYAPIGEDAYVSLLQGNIIGMHATVLYRREALAEVGGYDIALRRCEDYDAYLRIARRRKVASYPDVVAEYRWHGGNMSSNDAEMLEWVLKVHDRQVEITDQDPALKAHRLAGRYNLRRYYAEQMLLAPNGRSPRAMLQAMKAAPKVAVEGLSARLRSKLKRLAPAWAFRLGQGLRGRRYVPAVGKVDFGDFGGVRPISEDFGYDRGQPVDRYYIEAWLERRSADVRGRVLEIGDDAYSRRFGGDRIRRQDILHVHAGNPIATIVGDLSEPDVLPTGVIDCMVLTQTLHLIYDMPKALREIRRSLAPGGVLLATVPGITRIDRGEWGENWFWSLSTAAARRLFGEIFGATNVEVETFGNAYAATCFIQGLCQDDIDLSKLEPFDPGFPVIVAVRAVKAA